MKKIIFTVMIAVLVSTSLHAQVPQSGYVITKEKDTIAGTIDYLSDSRNCKTIIVLR